MMKKQAIIDRRPPVFISMICGSSMKYYDKECYDILYDMMNNTKMRYVISKKYSPPIVGAREIRYWRFQESLLAVKFHPPLFLFVLLVHVDLL